MKATTPPEYDLRTIDLPCLSGVKLRMFVRVLDSPLRHLVMPWILRETGITRLRSQVFDEPPTHVPLHPGGTPQIEAMSVPQDEWPSADPQPGTGFRFATTHDYANAYREHVTTPEEIAAGVLQAIAASNEASPPLRAVIAINHDDILRQAEAATKRIRNGKPLGVFDGVPVGVKDEVDMIGYATTAGTAFLGRSAAATDSTVVSRLRAAGALLIGKTNMHEIGIGVTGLNPHQGTPRNPYAVERLGWSDARSVLAMVSRCGCRGCRRLRNDARLAQRARCSGP